MVYKTKLLNQLRVTAPIESLHNLIETLKSDTFGLTKVSYLSLLIMCT